VIRGKTERRKDIHDKVDPKQLYNIENGVADKLRNHRKRTGSDVDGELQLE